MKVDRVIPITQAERVDDKRLKRKNRDRWDLNRFSEITDPYDLDVQTILSGSAGKELTGSVSCPPCNQTKNSCYGTQCCSAACSGNPNCH